MRIGIIGSGMIGGSLATLWAKAGHETIISSRHPENLTAAPSRRVATVETAATEGEVVLLAIPFAATADLSAATKAALVGKVVVDAGNPFEHRDGDVATQVVASGEGSGVWTAKLLPGADVVKAFNTVYYQVIRNGPPEQGPRVGVPIAGDDERALGIASRLVEDAGMDPVSVGALREAARFDPDTPLWNSSASAAEIREQLGLPS